MFGIYLVAQTYIMDGRSVAVMYTRMSGGTFTIEKELVSHATLMKDV